MFWLICRYGSFKRDMDIDGAPFKGILNKDVDVDVVVDIDS